MQTHLPGFEPPVAAVSTVLRREGPYWRLLVSVRDEGSEEWRQDVYEDLTAAEVADVLASVTWLAEESWQDQRTVLAARARRR